MTETLTDALDLSEIRLEAPGYVELVFSLVVVWGFGDAASTLVAAAFAGPSLEANPWIRLLLAHDPMLMVALKAAVVLYAGVVLLECRSAVERVPAGARGSSPSSPSVPPSSSRTSTSDWPPSRAPERARFDASESADGVQPPGLPK
ncbi:hypothetical protein ACFQL4_25405 [Halosimplex aquaticum]